MLGFTKWPLHLGLFRLICVHTSHIHSVLTMSGPLRHNLGNVVVKNANYEALSCVCLDLLAKFGEPTISFVMYVRPSISHGTTQLPLDGFS